MILGLGPRRRDRDHARGPWRHVPRADDGQRQRHAARRDGHDAARHAQQYRRAERAFHMNVDKLRVYQARPSEGTREASSPRKPARPVPPTRTRPARPCFRTRGFRDRHVSAPRVRGPNVRGPNVRGPNVRACGVPAQPSNVHTSHCRSGRPRRGRGARRLPALTASSGCPAGKAAANRASVSAMNAALANGAGAVETAAQGASRTRRRPLPASNTPPRPPSRQTLGAREPFPAASAGRAAAAETIRRSGYRRMRSSPTSTP